ncbi:putative pilus assembly protein PilZ, type IV [Desulfosarcina variabilis str. Montpellier]|uniref:PilZ domain-containing protein n=1 Tax=Desulfosarcina variabilis TaxID=2300 RepID=UPI003AFA9626
MDMETCALALPRGAMVRFFDETGDHEITKGLFVGPEDNSEFITVPLGDQTALTLNVGDRLRVRYGYQGAMAEFCSELAEIIKTPVLLWRIQLPTQVNRFELRDHKRIQCFVSAKIESMDKGLFMGTIIRDISKSGARCVIQPSEDLQGQLCVDDAITLRCTFPGILGEQIASGHIAEVDRASNELTIGIRFTEAQAWVPPYH